MKLTKLLLLPSFLALTVPLSAARAAEESGDKESKAAAARTGEAGISGKGTGPTIDANELSKPPKLVRQAKVSYPKEAVGKVTEDVRVTLLVDLDDKGLVKGAAVLEPKTPTGLGFEDAALTAAYDLVFEPAELAGKPTEVQINYTFTFPVPKAPAPPPPTAPVVVKEAPVPVENFTGVLVERGTRLPMAGVLVTVFRSEGDKPVGFENITDAKGNFHFFDLAPGEWKVRIEAPSYYPFRTTEEIHPGERVQAKYFVERGSYNPFDVIVEAKRERKEVSRVVIESAVIEKMPGAAGDPLAVLQNFAGVARAQAFSGEIIVRGSAPYDTKFFFDGTQVPNVYHFGGLRSVLPVGMIDNLEFYPGNFSPYYSDATGGIVDVGIKKLKPKKVGGYADINLFDSGAYLEIPIGEKAAVAVAARRSYVDYLLNAAIPSDAPVSGLQLPRYYDYQLLANYRPTAAHDLRLFVFGSDDSFHVILRNAARAGTQVTGNQITDATSFYRGLLTYKYVPNQHFENTIRLSQGKDSFDIQFFNFAIIDSITFTHVRDTARYEWSKGLALTGGLDVQHGSVTGVFNLPHPPQEGQTITGIGSLGKTLHQEINGRNFYWPAGAFAELEWRPIKNLLLLPGFRFDYFQSVSQYTSAPRFTARFEMTPQLTLKGGVGLFYQQPSFDQTDEVFGTPTLKCERAIHYSAGTEWKPRKYITLDATGFYKDLSNMVSITQASLNGDASAPRYDNNGLGRVYGLELVAKHELTSKFVGWLAYTLMRAERRDSGSSSYRLFQYDQTHILTVFGSYTLPRNWQIGSRFRYVTGNPTTPVTGSIYDASTDTYNPVYSLNKYSARVPAFHQLDIRVDKRWIYNSWMLTAYLDLQNVYNRANPEEVQYNFNFRKSQYSQGLPIYPILGLKGEF
jgi:outer membrane receptor protein involved in Fe transport